MSFKLILDRDNVPLYPWYFADQCITGYIEQALGMKVSKTIEEFKNSHIYMYGDLEQWNEFGEYLFNRIRKEKQFYKEIEQNTFKLGDELLEFCESIPEDLEEISNEELVEIYKTYQEKLIRMRAWGWVPPIVDGIDTYFLSDYTREKLRQHLKKRGEEDKSGDYYSVLSSAEEMSEVQTEELQRLELAQKLLSEKLLPENFTSLKPEEALKVLDEEAEKLIRKHAEKFEWLTYGYSGLLLSKEEVVDRLQDSLSQDKSVEEQIADIKSHYRELKDKKEELLKKLELPEELEYLLRVTSFFMYFKDARKGVYQKSYVAMDPVIAEIASRGGLKDLEARYLVEREVEEMLLEDKDFSEEARKRTQRCVAVTTDGETTIYRGEEADIILEEETTTEDIEAVEELKGSTAYSGKIKGTVKIVLTTKDISKVDKGDILVSSATNPDLLPAMKKAAAFVTDTGGITCHAAIVSREMKKPCIVGTKHATKVFKDGDKVEVDADKGEVFLLS